MKKGKAIWRWVKNSVWAFPVILLLVFSVLTAFKISGSSVGMYHHLLYGDTKTDNSLLFGQPRSIRTDEWLVNTQMTLAQAEAGYPKINQNIGQGMDMSVIGDVPYREWSVAFKPQYWGFLVLPLEYAFALKWWLLLFLLIVSCYFLVLKLLPGKKHLAILLSLGFGLSPFLAWWYISATFATVFYGFFILILLLRIINNEQIPFVKNHKIVDVLHVAALGYILIAFALTMYPPFQMSAAMVVGIFFTGYLLKKLLNDKILIKELLSPLLKISAAGAIALVVVSMFFITRADTFAAINNTVYPGPRSKISAPLDPLFVFDSFLQPQLQQEPQGYNFLGNQSESANFILLLPFLLLPGFVVLIYKYRKDKTVDWLLLIIQLGAILLFVRAFAPALDPLYRLLPHSLPHERPLMAFGLIGFLQMILLIKALATTKVKYHFTIALYGLACFALLVWVGDVVRTAYPSFIQSWAHICWLALGFTLIPILLLYRKFIAAACLFLLFSFVSTWKINPLYQGIGFLKHGELSHAIQSVSKPSDTWVGVENAYIENIGLIYGRHSISGAHFYPSVDFWRQVAGPDYDFIYNRYAHVVFTANPTQTAPFVLSAADFVLVKLECSDFTAREIDFVASIAPLDLPCLQHQETVHYPKMSFYLYQVVK